MCHRKGHHKATKLFKSGMFEESVEGSALIKRINFNGGLSGRGKCAFSTLTCCVEMMESMNITQEAYMTIMSKRKSQKLCKYLSCSCT